MNPDTWRAICKMKNSYWPTLSFSHWATLSSEPRAHSAQKRWGLETRGLRRHQLPRIPRRHLHPHPHSPLWNYCKGSPCRLITSPISISIYASLEEGLKNNYNRSSRCGTVETNPLGTMRLQVPTLALLSGSGIWCCRELWCRSPKRLGSGVAVAVVQARSCSSNWTPSLGTSICHGRSPKNQKKKQKKMNWVSMLCSIKFTEHCKPAIMGNNKKKIII